jgi:hypothetical protein
MCASADDSARTTKSRHPSRSHILEYSASLLSSSVSQQNKPNSEGVLVQWLILGLSIVHSQTWTEKEAPKRLRIE